MIWHSNLCPCAFFRRSVERLCLGFITLSCSEGSGSLSTCYLILRLCHFLARSWSAKYSEPLFRRDVSDSHSRGECGAQLIVECAEFFVSSDLMLGANVVGDGSSAVACAGEALVEVRRVGADDPRVTLRGRLCVVARRRIARGTVVMMYQVCSPLHTHTHTHTENYIVIRYTQPHDNVRANYKRLLHSHKQITTQIHTHPNHLKYYRVIFRICLNQFN
jgi:hypothetical protein